MFFSPCREGNAALPAGQGRPHFNLRPKTLGFSQKIRGFSFVSAVRDLCKFFEKISTGMFRTLRPAVGVHNSTPRPGGPNTEVVRCYHTEGTVRLDDGAGPREIIGTYPLDFPLDSRNTRNGKRLGFYCIIRGVFALS